MSFDTAGCLTGVLRRLLCSGTFPSHPSDQFKMPADEIKEKRKTEVSDSPGIVAKLMGLDSLPDFNSIQTLGKTSDKISRSKSMNSSDFSMECDRIERNHRRVKTSISFREIPIFFEEENEEFISICFENGNETENWNDSKLGKRKKKVKKLMEIESSSEDSSPVSVLDFSQFLVHPHVSKSDSDSKSRRKLSPELENLKYPFQRNDSSLIYEAPKTEKVEGKCVGSRTKYHPSKKYREIWDGSCRHIDTEIVNSNWVFKFQESEDLNADFGFHILDQLLDELFH